MKKALLKTLYNFGAFAPFHWASRQKVLIVTYHRFSREADEAKISAREFELHLDYLKAHNRVLPLTETLDRLREGKSLPPNTAVITIDDGYADAFDIAFPLLSKFGFPATVYAITDFVDQKIWLWTDLMRFVMLNTRKETIRVEFDAAGPVEGNLTDTAERLNLANQVNTHLKKLPNDEKDAKIREIAALMEVAIPKSPPADFGAINWEQAREMDANNLSIESHTVTHPILTNVGQETLEFEMSASKARLEELLDRRIEHFCYPNGSLDRNVQKTAESVGYKSAVTTAYGFNDAGTDQFLMNRIDAQPAIESFAQNVSGFEAVRQRVL